MPGLVFAGVMSFFIFLVAVIILALADLVGWQAVAGVGGFLWMAIWFNDGVARTPAAAQEREERRAAKAAALEEARQRELPTLAEFASRLRSRRWWCPW